MPGALGLIIHTSHIITSSSQLSFPDTASVNLHHRHNSPRCAAEKNLIGSKQIVRSERKYRKVLKSDSLGRKQGTQPGIYCQAFSLPTVDWQQGSDEKAILSIVTM
jgi:hypothetical protein